MGIRVAVGVRWEDLCLVFLLSGTGGGGVGVGGDGVVKEEV